jgi:hypothetical protein
MEGIVIRKEGPTDFSPFKLKNFDFLERESRTLDTGGTDMESAEEASALETQ